MNDNYPTQAWIDFIYSDDFDDCAALFPEMLWPLKSRLCATQKETERSVSNFIWFMRFELRCKQMAVADKRAMFKVVS